MQISELFINLGIKGTEKTVGALSGVKSNLKDVKSVSFEAKAAILGAMYALGRLVNSTGKQGTELSHFNALMDTSTKTLQQYQWAAQQVGVSNEEVTGSFKSLQNSMTKILTGEGVPKGLARLAMITGDITPEDILKFQKNPEILLKRLQEYAGKETNKGLRNEVIKSFALGDQMTAALSKNAFRPEVLNRAPTYSDKDIDALQKNQALWANLSQKIEMAFGKLNIAHGAQLVQDLSKLADAFINLTNAMIKFSEQIGLFETIGNVMKGWASLLQGGVTKEVEKLTAEKYGEENKENFWNQVKALGSMFMGGDEETAPGAAPKKAPSAIMNMQQNGVGSRILNGPQKITPQIPAQNNQNSNATNNTTINQTFNGNNGSNAKEVGKATKDGVNSAFRQSFAQGLGG